MKLFLPVFSVLLLLTGLSTAQDFTGQWKGKFVDKSESPNGWGGNSYEYVLDLNESGTKVNGYSYTYFTDDGTRYYTICAIEGTVDIKNNYLQIREVKRTKTNVPERIRNCFQVHRLYYKKDKNAETLTGSWIPAPGQGGDCGHGITSLNRRTLNREIPSFAKSAPSLPNSATKKKGTETASTKKNESASLSNNHPKVVNTTKKKTASKPVVEKSATELPVNNNSISRELISDNYIPIDTGKVMVALPGFEKRNSTVLSTIVVTNSSIQVDLYDNGEIDGDSISLFYNDKLILAHQRLSDKPISLKIDVDDSDDSNELIMYADNLGTIPPNTALMVVTDGLNRYEVRITSDLKKSGAIRFRLK